MVTNPTSYLLPLERTKFCNVGYANTMTKNYKGCIKLSDIGIPKGQSLSLTAINISSIKAAQPGPHQNHSVYHDLKYHAKTESTLTLFITK